MHVDELPHVDEHSVVLEAGTDHVWAALMELDNMFSRPGAAAYVRASGCADHRTAGPRPLNEGSSIPGFRVITAVPTCELFWRGAIDSRRTR